VVFIRLAARVAQAKTAPAESPEQTPAAQNMDDRSREEIQKDENTFDPNTFSL